MQIVIAISDELYKGIKRRDGSLETEYVCDELMKAVDNGTILPKDRGRLIILSEDAIKREQTFLGFSCQSWISDTSLSDATVAIIEADAESEEKEE